MAGAELDLVVSRRHRLIEGFQTSAVDFYAAVEAAIARREVPDYRAERVARSERGF